MKSSVKNLPTSNNGFLSLLVLQIKKKKEKEIERKSFDATTCVKLLRLLCGTAASAHHHGQA